MLCILLFKGSERAHILSWTFSAALKQFCLDICNAAYTALSNIRT